MSNATQATFQWSKLVKPPAIAIELLIFTAMSDHSWLYRNLVFSFFLGLIALAVFVISLGIEATFVPLAIFELFDNPKERVLKNYCCLFFGGLYLLSPVLLLIWALTK